jgi:hypothetical protein
MEGIGLQFWLMSSLGRFVGDGPLTSLILYAVVPVLIAYFPNRKTLVVLLRRLFERDDPSFCVRTITYRTGDNMNKQYSSGAVSQEMEETSTERNNILQKALRLYINRNRDDLDIKDAELYMLQSTHVSDGARRGRSRRLGGIDDPSLKKLMGYQIAKGPKPNRWHLVDPERQIEFRYFVNESSPIDSTSDNFIGKGSGKGARDSEGMLTTFQLRCCSGGAQKSLDDFVEEALEYYKSLRTAGKDTNRYFFMPRATGGRPSFDDDCYGKGYGKGHGIGRNYKKYILSEHKTFDSLFFPEKTEVLKLLDDFVHAKGKFSTPGFPNKLGILLHGPPGTGKTSLIKSIAQYTKRHIVEVPLTKVKTNQELFDSMFDLVFPVPGEDEPIQMDFKDIVFVLEDVDAASDVVQSRTSRECSSQEISAVKGKGKGKYVAEGKGKHAAEDGLENCGRGCEYGKEASHASALNKQQDSDALNLAGLLNVLDGVVDSPGRIVVMTTNHPEQLDPALVRPGRINLSLELGHIKPHELVQMIGHIMQTVPPPAHQVLAAEIASKQCLTAAMVEQSCAETDSIDKLFEKLSQLSNCSCQDLFSSADALDAMRTCCSCSSSVSSTVDVDSACSDSHFSTSQLPEVDANAS